MTQAIPTTMQFNINDGDALTFNVEPLMHEIRHALDELLRNSNSTVIDLRSLPLAPGEEQKILDLLGRGEIQATLQALGNSEIIESGYPGVWIVTHYNHEGDIISRFIEVTTIPEILLSQRQDIDDAHDRLNRMLETASFSEQHPYTPRDNNGMGDSQE